MNDAVSKEGEVLGTNGSSKDGSQHSGTAGFAIDCTPGYKDRLRVAASEFIDRLIAGVNREGSPLEPEERAASTNRLNMRREKEARLIGALPPTMPATAAALSTGVPEGVLAQIVLLVDSRDLVDPLFEMMPGVPLVLESLPLDTGEERRSIEIAQYAARQRPGSSVGSEPSTTRPIAPFYWRHLTQSETSRVTSVVWYAQLNDHTGPFLAKICVDVTGDSAYVVVEPAPGSPGREDPVEGRDRDLDPDPGDRDVGNLRMRLVDAPEGEFVMSMQDPERHLGIYEACWPEMVRRPSDVFGRSMG
jgi:hypothetical protein